LPRARVFRISKPIELHFTPDVARKLDDLAAQNGRRTDDLLRDALAAYFDESVQTREVLNHRYDERKSGNLEPVDGEEAFARLKAKITILRGRD
jgi:predicted transcriptional regulator